MRTPICKACAWSKSLCQTCQSKLEEGSISSLDVEVSKILYKINETHNITNAQLSKTLDFGRVVILLTEGEPGILIGKNGKVVSALSSALSRKVRVVRHSGDIKRSIADMVAPARLIGVNTCFSDGAETIKVRLNPQDTGKLYVDKKTLQAVIKSWVKKDVQLVFE